MSTPSWRLPAARLEGRSSARCLGLAMLVLALLTLAYALLATDRPGGHDLARLTLVAGPALLALGLLWRRYTRRVEGLLLLFDGRGWHSGSGEKASVISAYTPAVLLAARVEVAGQCYPLLLCRAQYSREGWRRLRLGLGQAASGG